MLQSTVYILAIYVIPKVDIKDDEQPCNLCNLPKRQ